MQTNRSPLIGAIHLYGFFVFRFPILDSEKSRKPLISIIRLDNIINYNYIITYYNTRVVYHIGGRGAVRWQHWRGRRLYVYCYYYIIYTLKCTSRFVRRFRFSPLRRRFAARELARTYM